MAEEEKTLKAAFMSPSTLMLVLNFLVLVASLGIIWGGQTSRMDDLRERLVAANVRLDVHEKTLYDDRNALSNRLTGLETDAKYIAQTLQDLKMIVSPVPNRR